MLSISNINVTPNFSARVQQHEPNPSFKEARDSVSFGQIKEQEVETILQKANKFFKTKFKVDNGSFFSQKTFKHSDILEKAAAFTRQHPELEAYPIGALEEVSYGKNSAVIKAPIGISVKRQANRL